MKRRKFVVSSALAATAGITTTLGKTTEDQNEIYELKTYEVTFGGDRNALIDYHKNILAASLMDIGAVSHQLFSELGDAEPRKIWSLTAYPDFSVYQKSIVLKSDESFVKKSGEYAGNGKIYNRVSSSLLYAFDGLKQMKSPIDDASLFELRIYEGVNEDAVRRKIKMFNVEEIDLFYRTDLQPIFFGQMITGPYEPCLVYMLNFRNMDHRSQSWQSFVKHPDWNTMRVKEEYKDSVSNIRKIFLEAI